MARARQDRRKRTPFGVARRKMTLDNDTAQRLKAAGKVPRWIKDDGRRLMDAQEGGYEFVHPVGTEAVGEDAVLQERDLSMKMIVGKNKDGSPQYEYLMAIDKEFYDEDQARKEKNNAMVDEAIRGGNPAGLDHHGVKPEQGKTYVKDINYTP